MTTMAVNPLNGLDASSPDMPGQTSFAITPSDANELPAGTRYLYVGGAGNIKLTCINDDGSHTGVTLTAVPVGTFLKLAVRHVYATGTTATLLVGFG